MGKEHLYIIGNGFDRYHGAKSSYWDFRGYLLCVNDWCAKMFELFFGPRSLSNNFETPLDLELCLAYGKTLPFPKNTWATKTLWCDFENYLSEFDREKVFDFLEARLPSVDEGHDAFLYSDFYAAIEYIEETVFYCSNVMQYHFHRWVNTLQYRKGHKHDMIRLDPDAVFLNFNYTLFLEEHYNIPREQICYIHGHRKQPFGTLVLGHREIDADAAFERWYHKHENRKRYRPNLKDKKGRYFANDKLAYLAYFHDDETEGMGNYRRLTTRYYCIEQAIRNVEEYFSRNVKHCEGIIKQNQDFFESLHDVRKITVMGHSLSDVDMPYFMEILRHIDKPEDVEWQITCHDERDIKNRNRFFNIINRSESKAQPPIDISDFKTDWAGVHSHSNEGATS